MLKLKAPENCGTHVSFDGELYEVKNGIVELPDAASELMNHGFSVAPDAVDEDEQPRRGGRPRRHPATEDDGGEA